MDTTSPTHVVVFPFMAYGHTIPLLDFSKALACRGVKVTIVTTPSNAPFIISETCKHPTISLSIIPFPKLGDLPEGCENTADLPSMCLFVPFLQATKTLKQPFEKTLQEMDKANSLPICVVSDFFLGWTLESCRLYGIPRLCFHGTGALAMTIVNTFHLNATSMAEFSSFDVLEVKNLKLSIPFLVEKSDFCDPIWHARPDDPFKKIVSELVEADFNSWGVVINTFEEVEGHYAHALESFYQNKARAWCVGPLLFHDQIQQEFKQSCVCIKWLDQQVGSDAVIYVSFGSQSHLSDNQMNEIAYGLEMAGQPFIWVVRSRTWLPPIWWEERMKDIGLIERNWVDQRSILSHPVVGGFMSHCGWNSVLESLSMGVPLLAWPIGAEQPFNAKFVTMELKAGIMVPQEWDGHDMIMTVDRNVICDSVKELMRGDQGKIANKRAKELRRMAREAVEKGGSSYNKLSELVECLCTCRKFQENQPNAI